MIYFTIIVTILIALGTGLFIFFYIFNAIRYVPFVPTGQSVVKKMVEAAQLKDNQTVYDLGCGDGRLLLEAMRAKPVKAIGIEVSWFVISLARIKRWFSGIKTTLIRGNFFNADLKEADVVFCYLFPKVMEKLSRKFQQELKKDAQVISFSFPIKGWTPSRKIQTRADKPNNFLIYCYDIPQAYES